MNICIMLRAFYQGCQGLCQGAGGYRTQQRIAGIATSRHAATKVEFHALMACALRLERRSSVQQQMPVMNVLHVMKRAFSDQPANYLTRQGASSGCDHAMSLNHTPDTLVATKNVAGQRIGVA